MRRGMWTTILCLVLLALLANQGTRAFMHIWEANDVLSLEDLGVDMQRFEGELTELDYFKLLSHEQDRIIVGARNQMYNISMTSLQQDYNRLLTWKPNSHDNTTCNIKLGQKYKDKCQNFIQVLGKMKDGRYYLCGTNALKPKCRIYRYQEENYPAQIPEFVTETEYDGVGKAPYDPDHNSTAIFTDGKLFSATVADIWARDPLIMESSDSKIRTEQHASNMLNDPHFVNSFDIDDQIYFFFREDAVENINCGKNVFSRVARICKKDEGDRYQDRVWTSFFKARMNCSVPGDIPFYFDEIQSTSNFSFGNYKPQRDPSMRKNMIYGVFNTPENSIQGSAICAFTLEDIHKAFTGKFKGQQTATHNWLSIPWDKTPSPHPAQSCANDSKELSNEALEFIKSHPLMDMAVPAAGGTPILMQTNEIGGRFTAITVDWQVLSGEFFYDVLFVGTSDGRVLKAVNSGSGDKISSNVIEDLQVLAKDEPVTELKVFNRRGEERLIVISKKNIVSIPLHRCDRHKKCGDCVALRDPYCAWYNNACGTNTNRGVQDIIHGDTSTCPDGGQRSPGNKGLEELDVIEVTTPKPIEVATCKPCECNCSKSHPSSYDVEPNETVNVYHAPSSEDRERNVERATAQPCENNYIRAEDQIYTASTLAIVCVVCIVVTALLGFVIGYRVSMCRSHTRNTEAMINHEQMYGSLRKGPNRHSIETSHNLYTEALNKTPKIHNHLVATMPNKNPNLPNGSVETKTLSPKQVSKTYI